MRRSPLLVAFSVAGVTGCAALTLTGGPDPRTQLSEGVGALQAQDYARARALLEPLYFQRWMEPVGQEALLALLAAELDGRNPERRLWAASDMASRLLGIPDIQPWMVPVGESFYLLAEELGAKEERVAQAEAARADAEARAERAEAAAGNGRALPNLPRKTVPQQIAELSRELADARKQLEDREQQIAVRDRELRDTRQELERIKKTIKP